MVTDFIHTLTYIVHLLSTFLSPTHFCSCLPFLFCCANSVLPFLMVVLSVLLLTPLHIGDDTQQHLKNIMLEHVTLDVVCDVVNFEHMKKLQCMRIPEPLEVWLLYTCVCIISVSCALKTPRPPKVSVRCCFLPIFC